MVNGAQTCYIEVTGKVEHTNVRFADNAQPRNSACQVPALAFTSSAAPSVHSAIAGRTKIASI